MDKFKNVINIDLELAVKEYEKFTEENKKINNPFLSFLKDQDVVINTVGSNKKKDPEHSRIIDWEVNKLLIDAC